MGILNLNPTFSDFKIPITELCFLSPGIPCSILLSSIFLNQLFLKHLLLPEYSWFCFVISCESLHLLIGKLRHNISNDVTDIFGPDPFMLFSHVFSLFLQVLSACVLI